MSLWISLMCTSKKFSEFQVGDTQKRSISRHIILKLSKHKGKKLILKVAREKWVITYKRSFKLNWRNSSPHEKVKPLGKITT